MEIRATKTPLDTATPQVVQREPIAAGGVVQPAPAVVKAQPERPVAQELQQTLAIVAEHLGEYLRSSDRDLEFRIDSGTHTTVITVRNGQTGDVVRQIPNETALRLMRLLNAESGTLVDLTA
jgi:flagellar protein FlaG